MLAAVITAGDRLIITGRGGEGDRDTVDHTGPPPALAHPIPHNKLVRPNWRSTRIHFSTLSIYCVDLLCMEIICMSIDKACRAIGVSGAGDRVSILSAGRAVMGQMGAGSLCNMRPCNVNTSTPLYHL